MKAYCITESREGKHSTEWPIVVEGSLAQCQLALARQGEPENEWTWRTKDGWRYYRHADTTLRVISRAWWADTEETEK